MFKVDIRLLSIKEYNNKISKIHSHKMQTAVANERAKTKYISTQRWQLFYCCSECCVIFYHIPFCWPSGFVLAVLDLSLDCNIPCYVILFSFQHQAGLPCLFASVHIFKVSVCTRALVLEVFCVFIRWIHHYPLNYAEWMSKINNEYLIQFLISSAFDLVWCRHGKIYSVAPAKNQSSPLAHVFDISKNKTKLQNKTEKLTGISNQMFVK